MDEKIIYRLWRRYPAAIRENTSTEWKKYLLACLRADVFPTTTRQLDFVGFVDAIRNNVLKNNDESGENENEHA